MVEVLVLQARTRQLEGTCCAERLLEQARAILAENPRQNDEFPPVLFALADAYTAKRKPELAAEYYQQAVAYQALQAEGMSTTAELEPKLIPTQGQLNRFNPHTKVYVPTRNTMNPYYYHHSFPDKERFEEQLQREIFIIPFDDHQYNVRIGSGQQPQTGAEPITRLIGEPIQFELNHLEEVLPGSYLRDAKLTEVSLKLQFSVMADGSVSGLEVISSNAPNKLAQLVKRAISLSKFRPRLVNGIATDTHQVEIMQTFPPINDIIQQ